MSLTGVALMRVQKELKMIYEEPPPGISAWACGDSLSELEAIICGAEGTPYANGRFRLQLSMPVRYPFEPPKVQFVTPIYHPNIDSAGRICLDTLNLPPKGAWKPSLNISTVLSSLQLLMSEPNPDDGLMVDITSQYINDRARFERCAIEHTRQHAMGADVGSSSGDSGSTGASGGCTHPLATAAPAATAPEDKMAEPQGDEAKMTDAAKRQRVE